MAFLDSLSIGGSALTASRLRLDTISENIANATTTRTENGGPYRRKMVVYQPAENADQSFEAAFQRSLGKTTGAKGVMVTDIVEDQTPFESKYDPTNPDADENGYVQMPNVDPLKETIDAMSVTRAYDANLTVVNAVKAMATKALELGR